MKASEEEQAKKRCGKGERRKRRKCKIKRQRRCID
jgi:hypothetical protein